MLILEVGGKKVKNGINNLYIIIERGHGRIFKSVLAI
jgi:hypothetical protein